MFRSNLLVVNMRMLLQPVRHLNTKRITTSVSCSSKRPLEWQANNQNLVQFSTQREGRKLAIILPWVQAKANAVGKYTEFYTSQDFDVITFRISVAQFLLPSSLDKIIKHQFIPLLLSCDHPQKIIHGLSVGGYIYGRMLELLKQECPDKKDLLVDTIKAQIWDSAGDFTTVGTGLGKGAFPKSPYFQKGVRKAVEFYLDKLAPIYYSEAQNCLNHSPIKCPALFLASHSDKVAPLYVTKHYQKLWRQENGISCSEYIWDDSEHVAHMRKYPLQYWSAVGNFLKNQGLVMDPHRFWQTQALKDSSPEKNILNI